MNRILLVNLLVITLLGLGLSGCVSQSGQATLSQSRSGLMNRAGTGSPYGVYDIQSGHGHGQWRSSPKDLVR